MENSLGLLSYQLWESRETWEMITLIHKENCIDDIKKRARRLLEIVFLSNLHFVFEF